MFADVAVGVMLGRQKQKLHGAHIGGKGQGSVKRLARRPAARAVAVKTEDNRFSKTKQLLYVVCRAGCAQCGHRVGKAHLRQRHHVHVAFGHQRVAMLTQRCTGFKQAVQLAPFAEDGRFGRIQVLGLFIA